MSTAHQKTIEKAHEALTTVATSADKLSAWQTRFSRTHESERRRWCMRCARGPGAEVVITH